MHPLMHANDRLIWSRYRQGHSASRIGRELGLNRRRVARHIADQGGIAPEPRCRTKGRLSLAEREEISRGLAAGLSMRHIAVGLQRPASTISREIGRNGGRGAYRAVDAEQAAWDRARRPKISKIAADPILRLAVTNGLHQHWSPEQIAGRLALRHPDDPDRCVSHEAIYRAVYLPERSLLPTGLCRRFRTRRTIRRSKAHGTGKGQSRGKLIDIVSIHDRPEQITDRTTPGHWEGDLVLGTQGSGMATLVERTSRYTELVKIGGLKSAQVIDALAVNLPRIDGCRSVTWDQGKEMAQHKRLAASTGIQIYFCDPHSPWQRGTNENTNGLLRQYFPKRRANLSDYSQADLDHVADQLNNRPRKILGYMTPSEIHTRTVAPTS